MRQTTKNIGEKGPVLARTEQSNQTVRYKDDPPKSLSPRQLEAFFLATKASRRDEALFRIMYCKGLRASEIGRLSVDDWDDREQMLTVHRLKGSRSGVYPMHDRELRALRAWLKERGNAPGPMFPSRNHRPISRIRIFELFQRYARAAGIPRSLAHPHVMKHSRGTHLLAETGKMHVVQDALGHVNIANTAKYAQAGNQERSAAVQLNRSKY
jgi:site-specific recombinase XerD